MPTISPFTEGVVVPQYRTTNYDSELEMQLLLKKQGEYDNVLSRLNSMQNTALNISMLNLKGKEKLDRYNNELQEMLSKDLGDLTDPKNQNRIASYFQKVATDEDLKRRSKLSQHYQQQISMIEGMRNAKDPVKSGYNQINETVFRKWTGGLEDFMLADSVDNWESQMQSYTPFKDVDQKMVNLVKLLHEEKTARQKPVTKKITVNGKEVETYTGYDVQELVEGVSSSRIRTLLESTLDADELSQLEILGKYRILQNSSPESKAQLFKSYSSWLNKEHRNTKAQLEKVRALKKQLNPDNVDSSLSPEEQEVKKALYQSELDTLNEQEILLTRKMSEQLANTIDEDSWLKMDNNSMLPYINQLTVENYVNGISDALSWKDDVQKIGMDEAYFASMRIQNMNDRLVLDSKLGEARIQLEQMKLAFQIEKEKNKSKTIESTFTAPEDIIKNEEELVSSWDKTVEIHDDFINKTIPLVTSKDKNGNYQLDPKNLIDKRWLNENSGNTEVKLWSAYMSRFRDDGAFLDDNYTKPNLAGFELFKKAVENGDYKNDPSISKIWNQYVSDKEVSQWTTDLVNQVSDEVLSVSKLHEVRLPGGNSLGDYARANGWTGKGQMTFGIPDGKGGYKQMSWEEVKDEYNNYINANRPKNTVSSTLTNNPIEALSNTYRDLTNANPVNLFNSDYKGILSNDPEFLQLVGKAINQEQQSFEKVKEVFNNQLPQWVQGKQQISNDPNTIDAYMGKINSATKLADKDTPLGLDASDIKQISRPYGMGKYGYFLIADNTSKNLEGRSLVTVGGKIHENPQPNTWYRYEVDPVNPRDLITNSMFENKGKVTRMLNGHEVIISDNPLDSEHVTLVIKGNKINEKKSVPRRDVNYIFAEVDNYLKQIK